jgi:hypothetical protein
MNIHLLAIVVFLMSSPSPRRTAFAVTAELCLQAQKKPASLAGFLFLKLNFCRLPSLSLPLATPSHPPHISSLITQTPSSL